jgi:hypothetical protein
MDSCFAFLRANTASSSDDSSAAAARSPDSARNAACQRVGETRTQGVGLQAARAHGSHLEHTGNHLRARTHTHTHTHKRIPPPPHTHARTSAAARCSPSCSAVSRLRRFRPPAPWLRPPLRLLLPWRLAASAAAAAGPVCCPAALCLPARRRWLREPCVCEREEAANDARRGRGGEGRSQGAGCCTCWHPFNQCRPHHSPCCCCCCRPCWPPRWLALEHGCMLRAGHQVEVKVEPDACVCGGVLWGSSSSSAVSSA